MRSSVLQLAHLVAVAGSPDHASVRREPTVWQTGIFGMAEIKAVQYIAAHRKSPALFPALEPMETFSRWVRVVCPSVEPVIVLGDRMLYLATGLQEDRPLLSAFQLRLTAPMCVAQGRSLVHSLRISMPMAGWWARGDQQQQEPALQATPLVNVDR